MPTDAFGRRGVWWEAMCNIPSGWAFFWSTSFGGDVCLPRVKRRMGGRPVASSIINLCSFGCARLLPNFSSSVLQAIPGREGGHTVYSPWDLEESRIDKLPLEAT